jgi:hypothetical protein
MGNLHGGHCEIELSAAEGGIITRIGLTFRDLTLMFWETVFLVITLG